MGPHVEKTQAAASGPLVLSDETALVRTTLRGIDPPHDGMTASSPCEQPGEPVAGIPHGGFYEGGQAQAVTTARPVPTHHNVRQDQLLAKVARRIQDATVMRLLKQVLKSTGKKGVPQGGVITPLTQKVI